MEKSWEGAGSVAMTPAEAREATAKVLDADRAAIGAARPVMLPSAETSAAEDDEVMGHYALALQSRKRLNDLALAMSAIESLAKLQEIRENAELMEVVGEFKEIARGSQGKSLEEILAAADWRELRDRMDAASEGLGDVGLGLDVPGSEIVEPSLDEGRDSVAGSLGL